MFRTLATLAKKSLLLAVMTTATVPALSQTQLAPEPVVPDTTAVRLRPSAAPTAVVAEPARSTPPPPYVAGEFERFVQRQSGTTGEIRRFGADLLSAYQDARATPEPSPVVPQDYVVSPGDEVLVTMWGSVEADLKLTVDRSGRISIPRVGAVQVGGTRYADLQGTVSRRVGQVFRGFELQVALGQLRGLRVFVTGFVQRPGSYVVNSLSTMLGALAQAGGPTAAGTFRSIELKRGTQLVSNLDLYEFVLRGDRSTDIVVQPGDVVHVGPVGVQVGVVGSVNQPTIVELKAGETVEHVLRMAGGFTPVADRTRLAVERLKERTAERVAQIELPAGLNQTLASGDVLRAFSAVEVVLATQRQNKRVRIEGEVMRPAEYVVPEGTSVKTLLELAGGFTPAAFVFASEFTRISVQQTQQQNYDRALRDLETELARTSATQRVTGAEEAAALGGRNQAVTQLVERLRALRPTGRVILALEPDSQTLPDMALEDGDRLYIPPRPSTVGVFGSVYNAASYVYNPGRRLSDYLDLAGGPTKGADESGVFVVRANGHVISERQRGGWFSGGSAFGGLRAEPGDSIFVPEETNKTTLVQHMKDWAQILSQFGLGAAAIKVLGD